MELNDQVIGELASAHNRILEQRSGVPGPSVNVLTRKRSVAGPMVFRGLKWSFAYIAMIAVFAWLSLFIIGHISGTDTAVPDLADRSRLFHAESPDRIVLAFRETLK